MWQGRANDKKLSEKNNKENIDNLEKLVYTENIKGEEICLIHLICGIGITKSVHKGMFCGCYFACHKTYKWIRIFMI